MRECSAEIGHCVPHGVVEIGGAFANRTVELGGDEAGLLLHKVGIVLPGFEEVLLVHTWITVVSRTVLHSKTDDVKVCWVRIFNVEKTLIYAPGEYPFAKSRAAPMNALKAAGGFFLPG